MNVKNISLQRSITSYATVQRLVSSVIRGKKMFVNESRIKNKRLLNVGCGPYPKEEFINLDHHWNPTIDICWDITKNRYPLQDSSLEGIFTEHCLEHIPFESCLFNLREFHRLLVPGGVARIVVPDGEIYCDLYQKKKQDPSTILPYGESEATGMISINRIMRLHDHLFIYDYETMKLLLEKAGFTKISKKSFQNGSDKRLLIDQEVRAVESLYVEAIK
jgi:predicted SAM-dependent methyltransferase